ncbi:hypothetical protein ES703_101425 [subsurface metagenome]
MLVNKKDLQQQVSSKGVKIMDLSSFIIKQSPKISQATGLRDPECGCFLSPLTFLRQGAREIKVNCLPLLPPVPCGALTVIGVSTLPQVR